LQQEFLSRRLVVSRAISVVGNGGSGFHPAMMRTHFLA
jgi:hypothetical protein